MTDNTLKIKKVLEENGKYFRDRHDTFIEATLLEDVEAIRPTSYQNMDVIKKGTVVRIWIPYTFDNDTVPISTLPIPAHKRHWKYGKGIAIVDTSLLQLIER